MSDVAEYTIGAEVTCSDGACGELSRVVLDPVARSLTHLVVGPPHRQGLGRIVPVELVDSAGEQIRLRCTMVDFEALEDAEDTRFMLEADDHLGYQDGQVFAWPYYGLGDGMGTIGTGGIGLGGPPPVVTYERLPVGEVDIRRGEHVHAVDGGIGQIRGLVIDPRDHHVTHVLLEEGHLWGKKEVAIPIGAVKDVDVDGVNLSLTRDQVRDLPAVDLADRG
jgi:sporulation protein YlmC with PRC-barrel domain